MARRLISDVGYTPTTEENMKYLIEEHGVKLVSTQNRESAKFLAAMELWETAESDIDPRKVAYNWKVNRGLSVKEAMTAQGSGHWLAWAKPYRAKGHVLDQDDAEYKKSLKHGKGDAQKQAPMPKGECEKRTGVGTYLGFYPTPHGYHHILTQADDPELAGNGAWQFGEYGGDIRCDRGYVILYDGNALADILRKADPNAPKTNVRQSLGIAEDDPSLFDERIDDTGDFGGVCDGGVESSSLPCPSLTEIGEALELSQGAETGTMSGGCPKCGEGETRFHVRIGDTGKPVFYCFKQGHGEGACNGVNDPQSIAKMYETINNRGDGAAAIAKVHRIANKTEPQEVCKANVINALDSFNDLTDYQRQYIEAKLWDEWYPVAVSLKEVKRKKDEANAEHKELLNKNRRARDQKEQDKAVRVAEMQSLREDFSGFESTEIPFEKGDINAFPYCLQQMGRAFRYNVIKMRVETQASHNHEWTTIDDHEVDEMFVDIAMRFSTADKKPVQWGRGDQMTAYKGNVYRVKHNPWQLYIDSIPNWDGVQRIHQSMDMGGMTIKESPISAWAQGVAWVELVRNGLYPGSPRFPELVLFGPGGKGKSSFLSKMLPDDMRGQYFLEGSPPIDSDDKIQIEKGAFLLCEGKEFGGGSKRDWEKVKEMWDKRTYTARLAYGRTTSQHRRCDTRVHTTNRRQLPEDDSAVSRRFLAVKVEGKVRIERRRGFEPWDWMDSLVDESNVARGTYRDQMFAEAKAIIAHHGGAKLEDGRWICAFNYLEYMAPEIANNPDALLKVNKDAGIAYTTEEGCVRTACADAMNWYSTAGRSDSTRDMAVKSGGVYDNDGELVAIKPRGLYSMMLSLQTGHAECEAVSMTIELLELEVAGASASAVNAIDRENGLSLALKRRFKSIATGGDEPLLKEDANPNADPFDTSGKRFRWLRPA